MFISETVYFRNEILKPSTMKKIFSFVFLALIIGTFSLTAQNIKIVVTSSADCSHRTTEFTVDSGKVAKLASLEIVTNFNSCSATALAPVNNYALVYKKNTSAKKPALYKKTVDASGKVTESIAINDVKLNPGVYVLEISAAPNAKATLELQIANN